MNSLNSVNRTPFDASHDSTPKPLVVEKPRSYYTRQQQIDVLVKKNPNIALLIERLGLKIQL